MGDIQTLYNQDAITGADLLNERVLPFFCLCPQRIFGGKPHSRPLAYQSRPVGEHAKAPDHSIFRTSDAAGGQKEPADRPYCRHLKVKTCSTSGCRLKCTGQVWAARSMTFFSFSL